MRAHRSRPRRCPFRPESRVPDPLAGIGLPPVQHRTREGTPTLAFTFAAMGRLLSAPARPCYGSSSSIPVQRAYERTLWIGFDPSELDPQDDGWRHPWKCRLVSEQDDMVRALLEYLERIPPEKVPGLGRN